MIVESYLGINCFKIVDCKTILFDLRLKFDCYFSLFDLSSNLGNSQHLIRLGHCKGFGLRFNFGYFDFNNLGYYFGNFNFGYFRSFNFGYFRNFSFDYFRNFSFNFDFNCFNYLDFNYLHIQYFYQILTLIFMNSFFDIDIILNLHNFLKY